MFVSKILAGVFAFCALSLLLAIILTIIVKPGSIPEDHEWDLPEKQILDYAREQTPEKKHNFVNQEIIEDMTNPTEMCHFEYRYIQA